MGFGKSTKKGKPARVIPSLSLLAQVRRIEGDAIEDYGGTRYAVWDIAGCDSTSMQVIAGWLTMLNSVEYPIQVLIRQHSPDMAEVRRKFLEVRPLGDAGGSDQRRWELNAGLSQGDGEGGEGCLPALVSHSQ